MGGLSLLPQVHGTSKKPGRRSTTISPSSLLPWMMLSVPLQKVHSSKYLHIYQEQTLEACDGFVARARTTRDRACSLASLGRDLGVAGSRCGGIKTWR